MSELLVDDAIDRWAVLTGGPGMDESAILSAWLARRRGYRRVRASSLRSSGPVRLG